MQRERQGILAGMGIGKRMEVVLRAAIIIAAALTVAACGQPAEPPSVVLIVLDTVRADHMSLYGYERDTTPRLARWARQGTVFENGFSAAAWTLPGVGSIFTGLYPSQHGAGLSGPSRMHDEVPTLAEELSGIGYETAAVANVSFLAPLFGLNRGFAHYDYDPADAEDGTRRADVSVDRALAWLNERSDAPSFLVLHLFDAHRFYDAPPPARGVFTGEFAADYDPATLPTLESRVEAERRGDMDFHVAAYDEEILWIDIQLDRFFSELRERGLFDSTLVILTGDHGEAFREHGQIAHGSSLHNEVIRVPMIVWEPGQATGRRSLVPVSTVDIVPTALDYAGAAAGETSGFSLRAAIRGEEVAPRAIFAQNRFYGTDLTALIRWPLKLLQNHDKAGRWLYDLEADPGETTNLLDGEDSEFMRLANAMRREARAFRQGRAGAEVTMSPEIAAQLRALGYIQ